MLMVTPTLALGVRLNCLMRIAEDTVEGTIAAGLVKDGIARELSLGYTVDVAPPSPTGTSNLQSVLSHDDIVSAQNWLTGELCVSLSPIS